MGATIVELDTKNNPTKTPFDVVELATALNQIREDVLEATWEDATLSAARCSGLAAGDLNAIYAAGVVTPPIGEALGHGFLSFMLAVAAGSSESAANFQAIRDALEEGDEPPSEELLARLTAIENGEDPIELFVGHAPNLVDSLFELVLATLVRGLLGELHGAFNLIYDAEPTNVLVAGSDDIVETAIKSVIDKSLNDLNGKMEALQALCSDSAEPEEFVNHSQSMSQFAHRQLPRLGRALARGRRIYERRLAAGQGGDAERIGLVCIRGGTCVREAIAATIAAQRLALGALSVDGADDVADVIANAADLEFTGTLPNGLNRQIHQLASVEDGKFVEIHGRVLSTSAAVNVDDLLIGRIDLQDPSSEATTTAFGFFINPANVGITVDTHVSLSGIFHPSADLNEGKPAVVIDKLSLAEIAKSQWRMAFLRLAFDWFPIYRNGHNLFWAIGPHAIGDSLDPANAGAAEIIFLDFGPAAVDLEEIE